MTNSSKYDLTQGSILNKLLLIALPVMATQFVQMTYNLTDMFWLGRLSSDAVAASGSAGMFMWLSMGPLLIARMGAQIGVSQSIGMGNREKALRFSSSALYVALICGALYGGALIAFNNQLIGFLNIQDKEVANAGASYLAIVGAGIPFTYISGSVSGSFNGAGNSKTPFLINSAGLIVNMILDPLLILTLDLGIQGAAIATITGQFIVFLLSMIAIKTSKNRPFDKYVFLTKPQKDTVKKILKWGTPIGIENMLFCMLAMVVSRFIASWGTDVLAAHKVGSQIDSLTWLIGGGFAMALTTFVGQNYGAGKWSRIKSGFRLSVLMMLIWGALITLLFFFAPKLLAAIFLSDPEVINICARYLQILAFCEINYCIELVAAAAFRGIGKTLPPTLISTSVSVIRIPAIYALSKSSLGLDGIWIGITVASIVQGIIILLAFIMYLRHRMKQTNKGTLTAA